MAKDDGDGGDGGGSLPDEQRCKRSDGRKWRCRRPVMQGKTLCEAHFAQNYHRKHKEPVPDHLKLDRHKSTAKIPQIEEESTENLKIRANGDMGRSHLPQNRRRSKRKEGNSADDFEENPTQNLKIGANGDVGCSNLSRKHGKRNKREEKSSVDISEKLDDALRKMNLAKGDLQLDLIRECLMRQVEKKKEKQFEKDKVVRDLKYGRLEISQPPSSSSSRLTTVNNVGSLNVKIGVSASNSVPRRVFRSKNFEPLPIATTQILPSVKTNVKASAKRKRCHWCRMCSYRIFIKCSTCKKQFFCEDCIQARSHDKADVKKECPVCRKSCDCRACVKQRSKDDATKELVYDGEKKFDQSQQLLYVTRLLLPLLEQINQEKIVELDIEARIEGKHRTGLQIQPAIDSEKQQCCSFCRSSIVDVHRCCGNCSYVLCTCCCRDFREGCLHRGVRDFKYMRTVTRKSLCAILWNWKTNEDGSIRCPPKNLGGCGDGMLGLKCLFPSNWTNDLEATAKESLEVASLCGSLCDGNDKKGSENLEHFRKHWVGVKGQPLVIRDVVKSGPELNWDPVFMLCVSLEASAKSRDNEGGVKLENCYNRCEVETGRKQIFMGGKTHANVQQEVLKFKVGLSSVCFRELFPSHYAAVMKALPLHEYTDPSSGILNMAVKLPPENPKSDLGPFVYISYGRPEELTGADFLSRLCYHAYDVVNILVHATERPVSRKKFRGVKNLMNRLSLRKADTRNRIDELFRKSSLGNKLGRTDELTHIPNRDVCVFSDDSSIEVSDDEDLCSSYFRGELAVDAGGAARWDVFRREDVPKLIEYLKKYASELTKKVVHPILDESFYLDAFHITKLKEEFDVEPWSIEQRIGEAVAVPAGCPYQIKKIKSCVNVVLEFVSPESALECMRLSEELRRLPVNHKAKTKTLDVNKMAIRCINAAMQEIRKVSPAE